MIDERAAPSGRLLEAATATCRHCCRVVVLNPARTRERGYCRRCNSYVCDSCAYECTPIEQLAELAIRYPTVDWLNRGPDAERIIEGERIY